MLGDLINQLKGLIDMVAIKYRKIVETYKARSALFRAKLLQHIKGEIMDFYSKASAFFDQFKVVQRIVDIVNYLMDWIKQNNIKDKLVTYIHDCQRYEFSNTNIITNITFFVGLLMKIYLIQENLSE